ncbi:hypothetical protein DPMN_014363, partial [Dreissena polymorpha]
MELKVWVDGIKRVVCGVTDNTTCQDIVIALAQAMGRTGRFTLIEKWRENERPLAPTECPLIVLQKWGEFAMEVKLILYESGTRKKHKSGGEKENTGVNPPDRFAHSFTPPIKTSEAVVIRRSLTFSGGRKSNGGPRQELFNDSQRHNGNPAIIAPPVKNLFLGQPEKLTSDSNSMSSNSSYASQNSMLMQTHQRSSSHERPPNISYEHPQPSTLMHSLPQPLDNHFSTLPHPANQRLVDSKQVAHVTPAITQPIPNHKPQIPSASNTGVKPNNVPMANVSSNSSYSVGQISNHSDTAPKFSSAFQPVSRKDVRQKQNHYQQKPDIPVYTDVRQTSHKHNSAEMYDLDNNFPDVVKETGREFLIEEYHVPGNQGQGGSNHRNRAIWEEEERVKLLRLVTMQNERIKMQDSQLDIINTEISSREQKLEDLKLHIGQVTEEISKLNALSEAKQQEIQALDNGKLIDDMEEEKVKEKEIKNEISGLRDRLQKCENDLKQFQIKVNKCSTDLEHEQDVLKTDEKRRKEEVLRLQNEISELKKDLNERMRESEEKGRQFAHVEEELKGISEELAKKTEDLMTTEKELNRENLKFFQPQQSSGTKSVEANGEDVFMWYNYQTNNVKPNTVRRN